MKYRILIFFISVIVGWSGALAQSPPDSTAKRNELIRQIQKKSPEQIREGYKNTHPKKPVTKTSISKKKVKKTKATKTISEGL